jgi:chitinase
MRRLLVTLLLGGCTVDASMTAAPDLGSSGPGPGAQAGADLAGGNNPGGDLAGPPIGSDGGAPGTDGATAPTTEVAPYFYTWGWGGTGYAFSSLAQMKSKGGPAAVTLAFVLSKGGCAVTTDIQDNLSDVNAYVAAGGHVKASFGGADGTYLENGCTDAASLASAIGGFVDATGIGDLDFDIEQGATSSNATINAMRATALAQLQAAKHIRVAFTLPVNPDGLDSLGLAVVQSALAAGVQLSFVNVMTMDYGNGTDLGSTPSASADATARQLQTLIPGLSLDQAYRMVGITPMIGKNDDSETFSVSNAQTLISYAQQKKIGLLAFWAIQRDQPCAAQPPNLDLCNGSSASTFQFAQIFASVNP